MVTVLATLGFLAFGWLLVLVGATQGTLARELGVGLEETGGLAAAVSLGLGVGVVLAGPAVDRWPRRPLFVAATATVALALQGAALAEGVFVLGLALALAGLGAGVFETVVNTVVPESFPGHAERRLALVHTGATVGAVTAPPLIVALSGSGGSAAAFRTASLLFGATALLGSLVRLLPPASGAPAAAPSRAPRLLALLPLLVATAAYVGFETALTAFAPALGVARGVEPERAVAGISALWMGLLVGRLLFLLWRGRVGPAWLLAQGVIALLVFAALSRTAIGLETGLGLLGIVLGSTFPILMALTARAFPERAGTAVGLVAGAGALGGVLVPWCAGALGGRLGPAALAAVLGLCCAGLASAGYAELRRRG